MGNNPLVSVIIPVYKVESFLNRCLRSVVGQSYKELEIILVDDGSPDKCPQMCEQWKDKDKRIKVIHKENGGLSSARNAGMKIMTGDYVCFVDSDDWIEPIMIEHLMEMIRNTKGADIAQCDYRISYKFESFSRQPKEIIKVFGKKEMLDYFFRLHGEKSNTGVWNKVISRNILDGFKFVDTLNEDVEASYEFLTRANKMVITNQVYYHYFVNKEGITNSNFKMKDLQYLSVCDSLCGPVLLYRGADPFIPDPAALLSQADRPSGMCLHLFRDDAPGLRGGKCELFPCLRLCGGYFFSLACAHRKRSGRPWLQLSAGNLSRPDFSDPEHRRHYRPGLSAVRIRAQRLQGTA